MGERGANRDPATPADIAEMAAIARDAVEGRRARLLDLAHAQPPHQRRQADADADGGRRRACSASRMGLKASRTPACCKSSPTSPTRRANCRCCAASSSNRAARSRSRSRRATAAPTAGRRFSACIDQCAADGLPVKRAGLRPPGRPAPRPVADPQSVLRARQLQEDRAPAVRRARGRVRTPEMRAALLVRRTVTPTTRSSKRCCATSPRCSRSPIRPTTSRRRRQAWARKPRAPTRRPEELAYDWLLADDGRALILFPFLNYAERQP